jgi:formylmethanofuran dehydrogenase subunit E
MEDQLRCDICGKYIKLENANTFNDTTACLDCYEENCVKMLPED